MGPNGPPLPRPLDVFSETPIFPERSRGSSFRAGMAAGEISGRPAVCRRAPRVGRGREGRSRGRLGCSDDRAPPPPRPAPALVSRRLPPPALLMQLLADMDVVNQVRVPAPRTEPAAARPPRPDRRGSGDSERWWPGSWQRTLGPRHWGWGLRQAREEGGGGAKKKRALCRSEGRPHCRSGVRQKPGSLPAIMRRGRGVLGLE